VELGKEEAKTLVNTCYRVKTQRERNERGEVVTVKTSEWDDTSMKINASVLQGLCFRAYKRHGQKLLNVPPDQVSRQPFYTNEASRETIMRKAFDITRLETRSRRFACEVKINGFDASVLLIRPLTEAEAAERAADKTSPRKKRRKTSGQPHTNEEMYAEEYRCLPDGYQPEVLIGVDPGKQSVVTAVIVGR
jgi:hypothetical protein